MKLEEAIQGNSDAAFRLEREGFEGWAKAVRLGIEALKREKEYRPRKGPRNFDLLPGETEE